MRSTVIAYIKNILKQNLIVYRVACGLYEVIRLIRDNVFYLFPIKKNKVVFDNFGGKSYGERPALIAEEIIKQGKSWDLVWISEEESANIPKEIRWVRCHSAQALYEISTAHIWIDNIRNATRPKKKKKQYYIQTWHGDVGVKKVEADAKETLSPMYLRAARRDGKQVNLFLTTNDWMTDLVRRSFWYNGDVMKVQYRDIVTGQQVEKIREIIRTYYNLPYESHYALYAPTFRNKGDLSWLDLDFDKARNALKKRFGGEWYFIIRLHPNISNEQSNVRYCEWMINATEYPNVEDLIYAADMVISDYSSIIFDAFRYKIKSLIYASDYTEYAIKERGFYFDLQSLPAPFADTTEQLINNIGKFDEKKYMHECCSLNAVIGYYGDSTNINKIVDKISSMIDL